MLCLYIHSLFRRIKNMTSKQKDNISKQKSKFELALNCFYGKDCAHDYNKAYSICTTLAQEEHAGAQYLLGQMYYEGHGVKQDYGNAIIWYTKAASNGEALAQYCLAKIF